MDQSESQDLTTVGTKTTNANTRSLDQARFELDKLKVEQDYALKLRELDLKARELEIKARETQTGKWKNPLALAIVGALLTGFTSIVITSLDNAEKGRDARAKARSDLIIESTRVDRDTGYKNLLFFIKTGLLDDPDKKITKLIQEDLGPSLAPKQALALGQENWVPTHGQGPNYTEALKQFRVAADQGDARAMANVGWSYENGFGIVADCSEAMKWYRKALAAGDAVANWNIGRLYDRGCGVSQDYQQARSWYEKAAALGVPEAFRDLKTLEQNGH